MKVYDQDGDNMSPPRSLLTIRSLSFAIGDGAFQEMKVVVMSFVVCSVIASMHGQKLVSTSLSLQAGSNCWKNHGKLLSRSA